MDASVPKKSSVKKPDVTLEEAMKAVETLIKWAGDDPQREGLIDTPKESLKPIQNFFLVTKKTQEKFFLKHLMMFKDIMTLFYLKILI